MDPDFQRGHVWDDLKKISYVEFIIRRGPSSKDIFFNCPGWMGRHNTSWGQMVLVDGKQRINAVMEFLHNKIKAFGYLHSEYEDILPSECGFVFNVNSLNTRREVLEWYIDMNSGGVVHTEDEIDKVRQLLLISNEGRMP
jgi:hypothetical protein